MTGHRRRWTIALALTAALLLAGIWGVQVARHGLAARDALVRLQTRAASGDSLALAAEARTVRRDVAAVRQSLQKVQDLTGSLRPLATALGWLPAVGDELAAAPHLLDLGVASLEAADAALAGGQPALEAALDGKGLGALADAVTRGAPDFIRAEAALRQAADARQRIARVDDPRLARLLAQFDRALPLAQQALRAALVLPDLMGMDGPRSYLVLGQNNDELRATGGFIGTAGIITLERGQVTGFDYRDSYAFIGPTLQVREPPRPFVQYMAFQHWHLRDSNWWADFPTSARKAEAMLADDLGLRVDGVVALDQDALVRILHHLGKVQVHGLSDPIDAANAVDLMERYAHPTGYKEGYVAPDPPPAFPGDRKAFIGALAKSLVARMQQLDSATALNVARTTLELLAEKHLLVSLHNPEAAALLRAQGWDGAVLPLPGDTLMVIETNIGYSKANKTVRRRLAYDVALGRDLSIETATVTVTYENTNAHPARHCDLATIDFFTADDSCYKSYLRVYAPPDSALIGMEGFDAAPETYVEGNRTVFASTLVLRPGETKQVRVTYRPPRGVLLRTPLGPAYRLAVQKQPGEGAVPFTLRLRLPPDARMTASDPPGLTVEAGVVTLATDLLHDRAVQIAFGR